MCLQMIITSLMMTGIDIQVFWTEHFNSFAPKEILQQIAKFNAIPFHTIY